MLIKHSNPWNEIPNFERISSKHSTTFISRYSFSGHESFFCKTIWLKKGYDAVVSGINFSAPETVALMGVGKNMVSSIRFWLKAFGLTTNDQVTNFAKTIFDDSIGFDPFIEDEGTLWLLHYYLVKSSIASIYRLAFMEFQREKKEFTRDQLHSFIKRKCNDKQQRNVYNANTVNKDISVFLHNYVAPNDSRSAEDYSAIFIDIGLIKILENEKFAFSDIRADKISSEILLYAILDYKGNDNTVSIDMMQDLALIFGLSLTSFIDIVHQIVDKYPESISYSDNSGIKNIQFLCHIDKEKILRNYYSK